MVLEALSAIQAMALIQDDLFRTVAKSPPQIAALTKVLAHCPGYEKKPLAGNQARAIAAFFAARVGKIGGLPPDHPVR